jgi:hypothetical protein
MSEYHDNIAACGAQHAARQHAELHSLTFEVLIREMVRTAGISATRQLLKDMADDLAEFDR